MKIILNGSLGRVGNELQRLCDAGYHGTKIAAYVDINNTPVPSRKFYNDIFDFTGAADCIIDFSHHSATKKLTDYAVERRIPLVIATTGHTAEELAMIEEASKKVAIFHSANMSLGVNLLLKLLQDASKVLAPAGFDIEIVEKHHNLKVDAPSGTAITLAEGILENLNRKDNWIMGNLTNPDGSITEGVAPKDCELKIDAIRRDEVPGIHSVTYDSPADTITITHDAHNRSGFALGAVLAAEYVKDHNGMLGMSNLFDF